MKGTELEILVTDCITHRMTQVESKEYIKTRYKEVSLSTIKRTKSRLLSDDALNKYFNEHTRIGFVHDQRDRRNEMLSVMEQLMRRWKDYTSRKDIDIHRVVRLAEAIVNTNKRLEEISLSNPVISKIKAKIDGIESDQASREDPNRAWIY
jgi:hypothetical protein